MKIKTIKPMIIILLLFGFLFGCGSPPTNITTMENVETIKKYIKENNLSVVSAFHIYRWNDKPASNKKLGKYATEFIRFHDNGLYGVQCSGCPNRNYQALACRLSYHQYNNEETVIRRGLDYKYLIVITWKYKKWDTCETDMRIIDDIPSTKYELYPTWLSGHYWRMDRNEVVLFTGSL